MCPRDEFIELCWASDLHLPVKSTHRRNMVPVVARGDWIGRFLDFLFLRTNMAPPATFTTLDLAIPLILPQRWPVSH